MKIVVCWQNSGERKAAGRIATMIRAFITRAFPDIEVLTSSMSEGQFGSYRNDAECLAAEAQRLLDAQEAAFGEPRDETDWWDVVDAVVVGPPGPAVRMPPVDFHDRSDFRCKARGNERVNPAAICPVCSPPSAGYYGGGGGGGHGGGYGLGGVPGRMSSGLMVVDAQRWLPPEAVT